MSIRTAGVRSREVAQDLLDYLASPGAVQDPYPLFRRARDIAPVCRVSDLLWVISAYQPAVQVLRHSSFSRQRAAVAEMEMLAPANDLEQMTEAVAIFLAMFANLDPPDHPRLRSNAAPAFRPSVMGGLEPAIRATVDGLIAKISDREVDFKEEFAVELPLRVICQILGVEPGDYQRFNQWMATIGDVNRTVKVSDTEWSRWAEAVGALAQFCRVAIDLSRARGGRGLLGELIDGHPPSGEQGEAELLATVLMLVNAGQETTTGLLANGCHLLMRSPGAWDAIRADRALVEPAVEEMLRCEPPARIQSRVATEEIELGGVVIEPGQRVAVLVGAANRDPDHFVEPDTFDVTRSGPVHLSFGLGAHFCLGAPLARMQARVAFDRLVDAVELGALAEPRWMPIARRSIDRLAVRVTKAPR